MLENVNLERRLPREEYEAALPALQRRLYDLEKACWDQGVSSVFVFEGWDAAGKGGCIATLTQRLDPRGFKLYAITAPRTYEQHYPWLWRFWLKVPNRGEMAMFDRSWYRRVLDERVGKIVTEKEWKKGYADISEFEQMLAADGTAILKFFFHITRKEQKQRYRKMEEDPFESWRISKEDWKRHRQYGDYLQASEEMLEATEREFAPWHIVEATSKYYARSKVFRLMIASLEKRLGASAPVTKVSDDAARRDADLRAASQSLEQEREI
jgi:polyphosphate kinase 2 (PPK2 family)